MFTNSGNEEIAVEAMKSGLDDYILKAPNRYIEFPTLYA
jgi:PleD family two-component response regulator